MDSANSGSMQSSNGGDNNEEFDSISSFFNPSPISTPQHTHFLTHQNTTFFDPQHTQNDSNDLFWSKPSRSDAHITSYANSGNLTASNASSAVPPPPYSDGGRAYTKSSDHFSGGVIKNTKKRTRASHRAPTTVLTTDAANFRQMVQEFTGIPAAPYSRGVDLFSAAAALRRPSSHLDALGPLYPIRHSAHQIIFPSSSPPPPPPLLNSVVIDSIVLTANAGSATATATATGHGSSASNISNKQ